MYCLGPTGENFVMRDFTAAQNFPSNSFLKMLSFNITQSLNQVTFNSKLDGYCQTENIKCKYGIHDTHFCNVSGRKYTMSNNCLLYLLCVKDTTVSQKECVLFFFPNSPVQHVIIYHFSKIYSKPYYALENVSNKTPNQMQQ